MEESTIDVPDRNFEVEEGEVLEGIQPEDVFNDPGDFHMILRSPIQSLSNIASPNITTRTPHSKSKRSSKKKSKKTPSRPANVDDIIDKNIDPIKSNLMNLIQMERMSSPAPESIPLREEEVTAPVHIKQQVSKSKAVKARNIGRASCSSLYAPTKSTMDKQRARSSSGSTSSGNSSRTKLSVTSTQGKAFKKSNPQQPKGPTIPVTPKFKTDERLRMHVKSLVLSSEDREMLEIEEGRKAEEQRVKMAKKVFQFVKMRSTNVVKTVVRSTKELTIPTTPVSHLMRRMGQKVCSNETGAPTKEEEKPEESFHNRPPTKFEPFQFATDVRQSFRGDIIEKVTTLGAAEAAEKFFRDPRSIFVSKEPLKMTEGHAPHFLTDIRASNHPKLMSTEEVAAAEFKEMQEKGFKAKPIDKRIFQSMGELGVPKVAAKKATEQVPFELRSVHRARPSTAPSDADRLAAKSFKARPMPSYSHEPMTRTVMTHKPTIAQSPKMSGGPRASSAPARRQREHHKVVESARKAAAALAAAPTPMRLSLTQPREFRLVTADRGLAHRAQLEQREKMEMARELAARNVHATAMPNPKPFQVAPSSKDLTEFREFNLRSLALHGSDQDAQEQENIRTKEEDLQRMQFQARPVPRTTFEPNFQIEIDERAPLVSKSMNFESDIRAEKRKEFDNMMALKMTQLEEQKEFAARRKLEAENRRIRELRNLSVEDGGMSFKASSITTKDLYPTKQSAPTPLTEPKSPAFSAMTHRGSVYGSTASEREMAAAFQQM